MGSVIIGGALRYLWNETLHTWLERGDVSGCFQKRAYLSLIVARIYLSIGCSVSWFGTREHHIVDVKGEILSSVLINFLYCELLLCMKEILFCFCGTIKWDGLAHLVRPPRGNVVVSVLVIAPLWVSVVAGVSV